MRLSISAALCLLCCALPLLAHAQAQAPPLDAAALAAALTSHDWQRAAAVILPILAWLLRARAPLASWAHSRPGALVISGGLALVGALAPVLDSHSFTRQSAISALTVAILSLLAVSNPTIAAQAVVRAGSSVGVGVLALGALLATGCPSTLPPPANPTACAAAVAALAGTLATIAPIVTIAEDSSSVGVKIGEEAAAATNATSAIAAASLAVSQACKAAPAAAVSPPTVATTPQQAAQAVAKGAAVVVVTAPSSQATP